MSTTPIKDIKKALETRLLSISPTVPTGFEGVDFNPPKEMYQFCQVVIRPPTDPVFGKGYYRENVQFQIFVSIPQGKGTGEALSRAELIRNTFQKGTTILEGGVQISVLETPHVGSSSIIANRVMVPIFVNVIGEVLV